MEEFPEPNGYRVWPGFVKKNPKNNAIYLQRCIEELPEWEEQLIAADDFLETELPGYNIVQIKDKFGMLRFYWEPPAGADENVAAAAREAIWEIEARAPGLT